MSLPEDVDSAIEEYAIAGKKRVQIGNESVEMIPLAELIQAAQYLKSLDAGTTPQTHFGLRFTKLVPPGAG